MNEMVTHDGEFIQQVEGLPALVDTEMARALARVEIDTQIATARQYPRSVKRAIDSILSLATLDEETATECIYALKRGSKPIRGPSIRLAEIIASQWGNCRDTAAVVSIDRVNKLIVAEGAFHDLETNRGTRASVQRRISDKYGKLYNDDMIAVTGNAACAIARRNAILAGVPKGVWRRAVEAAEQIIRGDASTLVERRDAAMQALAHFNLSPDQIFRIMDVKGVEDIDLDALATLRVIYTSLKNGEQTVEELLRSIEPEKTQKIGAATADLSAPKQFEGPSVPKADAPANGAANFDGKPAATDATAAEAKADAKQAAQPAKEQMKLENAENAETADQDIVMNDLDVIANDIIAQLKAVGGNNAALERAISESEADRRRLDAARRKKIDDVIAALRKGNSKKAT